MIGYYDTQDTPRRSDISCSRKNAEVFLMYVQQIIFSFSNAIPDDISDMAHGYLGALRMNGQIQGREWSIRAVDHQCVATVLTPESDSLAQTFNGQYVKKALIEAEARGAAITTQVIGQDIEGAQTCSCKNPSAYILYTTFLSLESPVRCLDCFKPVPLYTFPVMPSGEFYEIICWNSNYQACDLLQMNCTVLERSTTRQLTDFKSQLSVSGTQHCETLSSLVSKPFYYYLYHPNARSLTSEKKRLCPSCGQHWYLEEGLHSIFRFKCDRCRLVSNLAWNISG
jgi:predicted  nucleic acid-binding Zn ribbon protein